MSQLLARTWAALRGRRYGDYIWTSSGDKFWPLDPSPEDIYIRDIARGLATGCRYSGQIGLGTGYTFYSVAEHSVIVSMYAEYAAIERGADATEYALAGLLHDASEAYIGDVSRPLKYSREMRPYLRIEQCIDAAVRVRFCLAPDDERDRVIKSIDNRILIDEIEAFMLLPPGDDISTWVDRLGQPLECTIAGLSPEHAYDVFLQRYRQVTVEV